ncbi:hypothetical protein ES703_49439 [subsurface metagenome]
MTTAFSDISEVLHPPFDPQINTSKLFLLSAGLKHLPEIWPVLLRDLHHLHPQDTGIFHDHKIKYDRFLLRNHMHKNRPLSVLQSIILLKLITGIDSNLSKIRSSFFDNNIILNKLQILNH